MLNLKTLKINEGASFGITASNWNKIGTETILLTEVEGWDEMPDVIRNTAPRLDAGQGIYQSTAARWSERVLTFTMHAEYPDNVTVYTIRQTIKNLAKFVNVDIPISMTYYAPNGTTEVFKQTIMAKPGAEFLEWTQIGNSVTIVLTYIAADPFYTEEINGVVQGEKSL